MRKYFCIVLIGKLINMKKTTLFILSLPLLLFCGCENSLPLSQADIIGSWVCIDEAYTQGDGRLTLTFDGHSVTSLNTTKCNVLIGSGNDTLYYSSCESIFGGEVITSPEGEIVSGGENHECYKLEDGVFYEWGSLQSEECDCSEMPEDTRPMYQVSSYDGEVLTLELADGGIYLGAPPMTYRFVKL